MPYCSQIDAILWTFGVFRRVDVFNNLWFVITNYNAGMPPMKLDVVRLC